MKHNLKTFPKKFQAQGTEYFTPDIEVWLRNFTEELQQLEHNPVKLGEWIRQNADVKTTGELLKRFINKVILGENQQTRPYEDIAKECGLREGEN